MMNGMIDSWKSRFFQSEEGASETLAASSLAAGVGLFILSMFMVLAIGFVAGAMVLIERVAYTVLHGEEEKHVASMAALPAHSVGEAGIAAAGAGMTMAGATEVGQIGVDGIGIEEIEEMELGDVRIAGVEMA